MEEIIPVDKLAVMEETLIVDKLDDLPSAPRGWVFVRETAELYVERAGEWELYVEPPTPNLWTMLEDDA